MSENTPEPDNDSTIVEIDKKDKQYTAAFASPYKRFISHVIDSLIIYSVISLVSFFIVRNEIREEIDKINEANMVVMPERSGKSADNITVVTMDNNSSDIIEKKYSAVENIIFNKLTKNKLFRYIVLVVPIIYYILFLYYRQNTLGEGFIGLIVVRSDGQKLGLDDIIKRVFLFMISKNLFIAPVAIILPIFSTKNKMTLYDFFSNSYVIEVSNA